MSESEFEYLEVEVTRNQGTEVFLKVPKGWRLDYRSRKLMGEAVKKTVREDEWDTDWPAWQNDIEIQGFKVIPEDEAKHFRIFEVPKVNKTEAT